MANKSMGRFVIEWAGEYNPATAYVVLKAVSLNGSSYLCIAPCTNKDPETETAYWALMASKGDQGNQDIVDAAEAAQTAASSSASAAAASAALAATGLGSPRGAYADLAALNTTNPNHDFNYTVLDNGHWCYYDTGTSAFVDSGYVWQATSDHSEVLDGRTDGGGNVWSSLGASIRAATDGGHLLFKTGSSTQSYALTIAAGTPLTCKVKNTAATAGWFIVQALRADNSLIATLFTSRALDGGEEYTQSSAELPFAVTQIKITNTNSKACELTVTTSGTADRLDEADENLSGLSKRTIETEYYTGGYGQISSAGAITYATSGTNRLTDRVYNVELGDSFIYSGAYNGWGLVWGYHEDGTAVNLVPAGTYIGHIFTITDADIKYIVGWNPDDTLSLKNYAIVDAMTNIPMMNADCATMNDMAAAGTNATVAGKTATGLTLTLGTGVDASVLLTAASFALVSGDYVFYRIKLSVDVDTVLTFAVYPAFTSIDMSLYFRLSAGVVYEIYIRTMDFTADGTLKLKIESAAADSAGQVITITDLMMVKNSYEVWRDYETKQTLKDYTSRELVVDCNGGGHFYRINDACIFAKRAFDTLTVPVTIRVRNGYYLEQPTNAFPYAPINKGANRISIVGDSTDGVVIACYNTATIQSKTIDIGGPCTIDNLTIKSLNDGTYNAGNDLVHNPYCIHNDSAFTATVPYKTTVKNCRLYSECSSPVGAGLRNYQTQRYENCDFVSDGVLSGGALYVHASSEAAADNMGVEIVNCRCVSLDGTKAISLPGVVGSLPYTDIPVTIQNTIGYTTGADVTDANFEATHDLQPWSAGNNIEALNA